jgi:hypothetical protein
MMQVILSGALMILVGLITALLAQRVWQIQLRWLWCGALLWVIAVGVKFLIAGLLNRPVLLTLRGHLTYPLFLVLGASYIGLLTGVTEVLFTLIAALRWRQMTYDARRAVGIGLGAGAIQAICLGLASPFLAGDMRGQSAGLSIALLTPAIERVLCIPTHTAVRAMTLYAIATRRWSWFWGAFTIFTAIDGTAGFYLLTRRSSVGYLVAELCLITFMVMSLFLLRYLWKHWPSQPSPAGEATGRQLFDSEADLASAASASGRSG